MVETTIDISNEAFSLAFRSLVIGTVLTVDEMEAAPAKIRNFIEVLVSSGERDPQKIARTAVCLVRENDQISRSVARVTEAKKDLA